MKTKVRESTRNGQLHHLLKSTYYSEASFNYSFVNAIKPWCACVCVCERARRRCTRVDVMVVTPSLGEAHSFTPGTLFENNVFGLVF